MNHAAHVVRLGNPGLLEKLAARHQPYWEPVGANLYLGFYKGARRCTWHGRKFVGNGRYKQTLLGACSGEPGGIDHAAALFSLRAWARGIGGAESAQEDASARQATRRRDIHALLPGRLDHIAERWAAERPDVDFWPMGFFLRIEYAHALHERRVAALAKSAGVHVGELHVLLALRRNGANGAMRPTDLYRELLITSGAITKRLNRLATMRMVSRATTADDRRCELVRLTRAGCRLADAALNDMHASLSRLIAASGLSREQLEVTDACFRRLLENM